MKYAVYAFVCVAEILFVVFSLLESLKVAPDKDGFDYLFRKYVPVIIIIMSIVKIVIKLVPGVPAKYITVLGDLMIPVFLIYLFSIGEVFNGKKWFVLLIAFCLMYIAAACVLRFAG